MIRYQSEPTLDSFLALSRLTNNVYTQGIVVGLDNLDEVIRVIREASSNTAASAALRNGKLLFISHFFF